MKRAADGEAKTGGGGGQIMKGGASTDQKVEPIPRPFRINSITLHFNQRTWEEIGPGELKMLPLSLTPYYMLGEAERNLLLKYKGLWSSVEYHTPHARLTNLIMLQDDLINQGGTPMETTAFTQACYMMKYTPTRQSLYFQLANLKSCKMEKSLDDVMDLLVYNLAGTQCDAADVRQLISIANYTDFEKLALLTAEVDEFAGYEPRGLITTQAGTVSYQLDNTFIPPNRLIGKYAHYSANLQPAQFRKMISVVPFKQVTFARNLDKISLHRYGDVIELPIHTNIEGLKLINVPENDILMRNTAMIDKQGDVTNTYLYNTEFAWPSNNRPYYNRRDNLNEIMPMETSKNMKPLSYHFLTMPPIRKANGALLKQRCSFMLDQSFSLTFHFPESVWDDHNDDPTHPTSEMILNQKDGAVLRPMLYGHVVAEKRDEKAICPDVFTCTGERCPYDNSFASLLEMIVDYYNERKILIFEVTSSIPGTPSYVYTLNKIPFQNTDFFDETFATVWKNWLTHLDGGAPLQNFYINLSNPDPDPDAIIISLKSRNGEIISVKGGAGAKYLRITPIRFATMTGYYGVKCAKSSPEKPQMADYKPLSRDSNVFYV
nr:MAG: major capsid protein [Army ant associated bidensovirus 6]